MTAGPFPAPRRPHTAEDAAVACAAGGVLTLVGLVHGEEVVSFSSEPRIALGSGPAAVVCLGCAARRLPPRDALLLADELRPALLDVERVAAVGLAVPA